MSYSFLFNNNNSSSGNGIYSLLSEYNNIKSGTYYKVVKAYYAKQTAATKGTKDTESSKKAAKAVQSENAKKLNKTQSDAKSLTESAEALMSRGSDSVFKEVDITTKNDDGTETTTKGYDTDAIYKAVKKFADNYNNLVDSGSKSVSGKVQNQVSNMVSGTQAYEKMLNKIGISIGSDDKLSIDEKAFKAADMTTVKTMFNGNSSFAGSVSSRASMINYTAQSEANKSSLYTNRGSYNNVYSSGSFMNSFF